MAHKHDVVELIISLSKSEKRYIRMQVSLQGQDKVYLKLMDAIEKDPDTPDTELRKIAFGNKGSANSLFFYKNYLYQVIMKSLRSYHQKDSKNQEFLTVLANLEVLFRRGLYNHCRKIIQREKKNCYLTEKYNHLLELISMEKRLISVNSYSHISYQELNTLYKEEQRIIEIVKRLSSWWRVINIVNKNMLSEENKRAYPHSYYQKILESKYMHYPPDEMLTLSERYHKNALLAGCYYALGDEWNYYLVTHSNVKLMDHHPQLRNEEINRYLSMNYYLMKAQLHLGMPDDVLHNLDKLEALGKEPVFVKSENVLSRLSFFRIFFGIKALLKKEDFDEAEKIAAEFTRRYREIARQLDPVFLVSIKYYKALLDYRKGHNGQALQTLQDILNDTHYDTHVDVFRYARILQAVIHHRLKNTEVLDYLVKALYSMYRHAKGYYKAELLTVHVLAASLHKKPNRAKMENLHMELLALKADVFEKEAFEFFDTPDWLNMIPAGFRS